MTRTARASPDHRAGEAIRLPGLSFCWSALMTSVETVRPQPGRAAPPPPVESHYTQTDSFPPLLHELNASLLISTYQANKLLVARAVGDGLSTLVRTFDRPMGLAVDGRRMVVGTRDRLWFLHNAP